MIVLHDHARARIIERGANEDEVTDTILQGESFSAKHGRTGFRRNFSFDSEWRGKTYSTKQIEVFAVKENENWIVITVLVKYF